MEHLLSTGILDFGILSLGFLVGVGTKFRTPIMISLFLIKIIKWWIETHPHGKEMARKTKLDMEFKEKFVKEIKILEDKLKLIDKK